MKQNEIRLVALDMDGTLLHDDKTISPRTVGVLEKLVSMGIRVVPATGRGLDGLKDTVLKVKPIHHAICSNGATIQDAATEKVLYSQPIPKEEALLTLEHYRDRRLFFYLHTDIGPIRPEGWQETGLAALYPHLRFETRTVPDLAAWLRASDATVLKMGAFAYDGGTFRSVLSEGSPSPSVKLMRTGDCNIEFNSALASKGNALKALCAMLDIPVSRTLAIGDNQNDLEMLSFAGVSAAMGNAEDDVKAAAGFVTGTNNEDGAAAFLEKYFGL